MQYRNESTNTLIMFLQHERRQEMYVQRNN